MTRRQSMLAVLGLQPRAFLIVAIHPPVVPLPEEEAVEASRCHVICCRPVALKEKAVPGSLVGTYGRKTPARLETCPTPPSSGRGGLQLYSN